MFLRFGVCLYVLTALVGSGVAGAAMINVTLREIAGSPVDVNLRGERQTLIAGEMRWSRQDSDSILWRTFCIELEEPVAVMDSVSYTRVSLPQARDAEPNLNSDQQQLLGQLWSARHSGAFTKVDAAAFQLAVWEVVYDGRDTLSLGDGQFSVNGRTPTAVKNRAAEWLNSLVSTPVPAASLAAWNRAGVQDQLIAAPLPAPVLGTLATGGLLGLSWFIRRRRAKRFA